MTTTLRETIHNCNMECGEIIVNFQLADEIQRLEFDLGCEFTPSEILKAVRDAADSFVDSMIQNEYDTEEEGRTDIAPLEDRISRWEMLRPMHVRRQQLTAILCPPVANDAQVDAVCDLLLGEKSPCEVRIDGSRDGFIFPEGRKFTRNACRTIASAIARGSLVIFIGYAPLTIRVSDAVKNA